MKKIYFLFVLICLAILLFGCKKTEDEQFVDDHMAQVFYASFKAYAMFPSSTSNFTVEGITITNVEFTYFEYVNNQTSEAYGDINGSGTVLNILFSYDVGEDSEYYDADNISRELYVVYNYSIINEELIDCTTSLGNTRESYEQATDDLEEKVTDTEDNYYELTNLIQGTLTNSQINRYIRQAYDMNEEEA